MEPNALIDLFERCIELVNRVPDVHRQTIMNVAERLLVLVDESLSKEPAQNAPTSYTMQ
jgi:hypothetical protein